MAEYLMQRAGGFHFRRAVPFELQPFFRCTEIWKSLGTRRKYEARIIANRMAADFDRILFLVRAGILSKEKNRDALLSMCKEFRLQHDLNQKEVSMEDLKYIEDLAHRHLLYRLSSIDTSRSLGVSQVQSMLTEFDESCSSPSSQAQIEGLTLLASQQGTVVAIGSNHQLALHCQEEISKLQNLLSSAVITPYLINHANKVLDQLGDNQLPRHSSMVYDNETNDLAPNCADLPPLFHALCLALLRTEVVYYQEELKRLRGVYSSLLNTAQKTKSETLRIPKLPETPKLPMPLNKPTAPSPKISEVISTWLAWYRDQDTASDETLDAYEKAAKLFIDILEEDKPMSDVTTQDVETYLSVLRRMPPNFNKSKEYRELLPRQIVIKAEELGAKTLSFDTISFKLRNLKQFITWSFDRKYMTEDVGKVVVLKKTREQRMTAESEERDAFNREDLLAIAHGLVAERAHKHEDRNFKGKPARYWLPLLSLFTGCRAEELAQLLISDVYQTESGLWCIQMDYINDNGEISKNLKTANSKRSMPLHKTLINLGFIDYYERIKAQGNERLWPQLKTGKRNKYHRNVTEWFNSTSRKNGIKNLYLNPETSEKKCFHSLRHTFSTGLENALVPEIIASRLMGHKNTTMSYGRYSKGVTDEMLFEEGINKLDYGVDFVDILGTSGAEDL
jgi:integrase